MDWFRFGLAKQRTHVYQTGRDAQRGVLSGVSYGHVELATYVFDPETREPTVIVAVGARF